jgi:hypothetical protein
MSALHGGVRSYPWTENMLQEAGKVGACQKAWGAPLKPSRPMFRMRRVIRPSERSPA